MANEILINDLDFIIHKIDQVKNDIKDRVDLEGDRFGEGYSIGLEQAWELAKKVYDYFSYDSVYFGGCRTPKEYIDTHSVYDCSYMIDKLERDEEYLNSLKQKQNP